ncbi:MAG: flippase-like domain-containing protein [Chloroflexi bacterium]|nr:flippase-like domain-containing protein [Chloroflexota bacterium]
MSSKPVEQKLSQRRSVAIGRIVLGVGLSLGLGWLAIRGLDWALVGRTLRGFPISSALLAVGLLLVSNVIRAFRWRVLFIDQRISAARLFLVQNIGIGVNNLVPFRVISEATQFTLLTLRNRINPATALATLGMERVLDVVSSTILLMLAFVLIPEMKNFAIYIWGTFGFTVFLLALVHLIAWSGKRLTFLKRFPFLPSFAAAVALIERHPWRLTSSLALTILIWIVSGISTWIVARDTGVNVNLVTATAILIGVLLFATAVPAMPAAIGTFEFVIVYVLGFFGIKEETSFGFAVIIHALFFVPPTVIALVFLPSEGIGSLRKVRALTSRFGGMTNPPSS